MTAPALFRITKYIRAIDPRIAAFEVRLEMVERGEHDVEFFPILAGAWDEHGEPLLQDIPVREQMKIADIGYELVGEHGQQLRGEWRERFEDADAHRIQVGAVRVEAVYRDAADGVA